MSCRRGSGAIGRRRVIFRVIDDALIHFDDDRARAALAVLGDVARVTQVLFFTHHKRLVELAREALPEGRLREHQVG